MPVTNLRRSSGRRLMKGICHLLRSKPVALMILPTWRSSQPTIASIRCRITSLLSTVCNGLGSPRNLLSFSTFGHPHSVTVTISSNCYLHSHLGSDGPLSDTWPLTEQQIYCRSRTFLCSVAEDAIHALWTQHHTNHLPCETKVCIGTISTPSSS